MNLRSRLLLVAALLGLVGLVFWRMPRRADDTEGPKPELPAHPVVAAEIKVSTNPPPLRGPLRPKVKHRASEFTVNEKQEFGENFEKKYKPAIEKWCKAFDGHVPFGPDAVAPENFVERIGVNSSYSEYIFVVDGITLGVRDSKGSARVDYLNAPQQTRKMATLPDGSQAPTVKSPVAKAEILKALEAESGNRFSPQDVRMIPSGFSGSLNGGVMVDVGGTPENGASWKYDMVFGPDGKLAYYMKGAD